MMRILHELAEEFPQHATSIEQLVKSDYEFGRLAGRYDDDNHEIFRIESEEEPTTDEVLERLKKQRLKLKDEITAFLGNRER